ncbi:hypothetical protein N7532_010274 [Penicillium argentinense]|uniref:C2H2-type domain-containing protein n=1 Tax=Penicillium argentinense TaxID=1131581 RepID=A0A9W9EPA5_9EURO|nr:uncharacterized protein N7532_010274 [Penicillium argentinense]KAJ5085503.1 hypothetical protein N7532_010274 [Penicillium argentinense]
MSRSYFDSNMEMFFPVDVPYSHDLRLPYYPNEVYDDLHKPSHFPSMPATPPSVSTAQEPPIPTGSASGPSIASAPSSAIGSPYSGAQVYHDNWVNTNHGLGLPSAVMSDLFSNDYMGPVDMDGLYQEKFPDAFVDPSLIQPVGQPVQQFPPTIAYPENTSAYVPHNFLPHSPATSPVPYSDHVEQHQFPQLHSGLNPSLVMPGPPSRPVSVYDRRSSISSIRSHRSQNSPALSSVDADDSKEKGRCPFPDCGRVFKDLKAHMLTHQSERPEKCPIVTCEYHTKGFARKYDKNRHTLTHYKGTMSFNRADVFKRHLTSVHAVEQTPPNCRKRSPTTSARKGTNYSSDATGKCSTCSATFSNAQDFYEHLDDCVLRVVQQEEPSEAINQQRLAEVAADEEVKKTMEKHQLVDAAGPVPSLDDNDSHDEDDLNETWRSGRGAVKSTKSTTNSSRPILGNANAITKNSGNNTTMNGKPRAVATRRRNNRGNYPNSWGCPNSSMKTKKRVLCVFDGQRRLWKDEMMLNNEFEVRLRLPGGAGDGTHRDAYVTDLDVETMKRAEGVLSASDEERGPWMASAIPGSHSQLMGQPAILLPDMAHHHGDDEISINELMA